MNANTGVWIGLGVLGAIIIASMSDEKKNPVLNLKKYSCNGFFIIK